MSDYIYREITKRDIDQLYASRDAEKWLIPYYQGPKTYYDVGKESIADPIESEEWKLFRFSVIKDMINYSLLLIITNYQLQYLCSCLYNFFYSTH